LKNKPKIVNLTAKQAWHVLARKFRKTKNQQKIKIKRRGANPKKTNPK